MKRSLLCWVFLPAAFAAASSWRFMPTYGRRHATNSPRNSVKAGGLRSFDIVPFGDRFGDLLQRQHRRSQWRWASGCRAGQGAALAGDEPHVFRRRQRTFHARTGAPEQGHQELLGIAGGHDRQRPPGYGAEQRRSRIPSWSCSTTAKDTSRLAAATAIRMADQKRGGWRFERRRLSGYRGCQSRDDEFCVLQRWQAPFRLPSIGGLAQRGDRGHCGHERRRRERRHLRLPRFVSERRVFQ